MITTLERLIGEIGDLNSKLVLLVGASRSGKTKLLRELLSGVLEGATLEGPTLLGATELRLLLATLDGGAIELLLVVDDEVPTLAGASLLYAITRKLSK